MDKRKIIIADSDAEYRSRAADFFMKAGYRVETTDSIDHVMCSVLEKQTPVLLLGGDFGKKHSSADLIHLLKKCNRDLHVIMVSAEMPLAQARKVRQEGIFYHALKPATAGDTEELEQAVACAFEKDRMSTQINTAPPQQGQPAVSLPKKTGFSWKWIMKVLSWAVGISALIFSTSYLSLVAANTAIDGRHLTIWIFLGFCALIVAGQLLPIFRIKLVLGGIDQGQASHEYAHRNGKWSDAHKNTFKSK